MYNPRAPPLPVQADPPTPTEALDLFSLPFRYSCCTGSRRVVDLCAAPGSVAARS